MEHYSPHCKHSVVARFFNHLCYGHALRILTWQHMEHYSPHCKQMQDFCKNVLQFSHSNLRLYWQTPCTLQTIYQHQLLVLPMSMFPAIVFQHYAWQIPTGLLVYPIHSAGIHHDKCSSLSKLLPTTPASYTNVHVSIHRLPISVCSVGASI